MANSNEGKSVHLEVKEGERWGSLGQVQLLDDTVPAISTPPNDSGGTSSVSVMGHRDQLPRSVKRLLVSSQDRQRKLFYLFRHATQNQPNTNLLVLLHGAGDSHIPFDKLGQTMALPQTATLSIAALGYQQLPFGLGSTWFQEMDYETGQPLAETHSTRQESLLQATTQLYAVLEQLIVQEGWIIPERVFFLGYGAGAALAMQLCVAWHERGHSPLGGAVCVAGGAVVRDKISAPKMTTTEIKATPLLLMVGDKDDSFPPQRAKLLRQRYYSGCTQIHVEPSKEQGMIQSQSEMQKVMEFLSQRLVRLSALPSS